MSRKFKLPYKTLFYKYRRARFVGKAHSHDQYFWARAGATWVPWSWRMPSENTCVLLCDEASRPTFLGSVNHRVPWDVPAWLGVQRRRARGGGWFPSSFSPSAVAFPAVEAGMYLVLFPGDGRETQKDLVFLKLWHPWTEAGFFFVILLEYSWLTVLC